MDGPQTPAGGRRSAALSPALLAGLVVVLLLGGLLLFFVLRASREEPVSVATILADLRTYDGQSVTLKGRALSPTNIFGLKYYDLDDGSGSIKVITERGLPAEGSEITVTGVVKQAVQIGEMELTVVYEPQLGEAEPQ